MMPADRSSMMAAEFLDRLEMRPDGLRNELVSGQPIEMAAGKNRHSLVKTACRQALGNGVLDAGLDRSVPGDGADVVVSEHDAHETGATVRCGEALTLSRSPGEPLIEVGMSHAP